MWRAKSLGSDPQHIAACLMASLDLFFLSGQSEAVEILSGVKKLVVRVSVGMVKDFVACLDQETVFARIFLDQLADHRKRSDKVQPGQSIAEIP